MQCARVRAGEFVKEYCEQTGPHFVVGEYWDSLQYEHGVAAYCQNQHRQQIVNWINAAGGQATAFDVTTKGILCAPPPPRPPLLLGKAIESTLCLSELKLCTSA